MDVHIKKISLQLKNVSGIYGYKDLRLIFRKDKFCCWKHIISSIF